MKFYSKHLAVTFLALAGQTAFAGTSLSLEDQRKAIFEGMGSCDQAVFTNDDYFAASLSTADSQMSRARIVSLKNADDVFEIQTQARIGDLKIQGDTAYVLAGTTLEAWSIQSKTKLFSYPTYPEIDQDSHWREKPTGFVIQGKLAIIAHGALGVSVVNLETGEFVKTISLSPALAAQDIAMVDTDRAVIAIDADEGHSFRGVEVLDLKSLEVIHQSRIDNSFPLAVRVLSPNQLVMVYFNAIWKFDLSKALSSSVAKPNRRVTRFPGISLIDLRGKVAFDSKYLYACLKSFDEVTGVRKLQPVGVDLGAIQLQN